METIEQLRAAFEVTKRIADLEPGDLVDLYGDKYADPDKNEGQSFYFEYETVMEVTLETADCLAVSFVNGFYCGFPPNHEVQVLNNNMNDWKIRS